MLAATDRVASVAEHWLEQFERALVAPQDDALRALFHADAYWRDVLALTWRIRTTSGRESLVANIRAQARRVRASGFSLDPRRTAPREVVRAGTKAIEALV